MSPDRKVKQVRRMLDICEKKFRYKKSNKALEKISERIIPIHLDFKNTS